MRAIIEPSDSLKKRAEHSSNQISKVDVRKKCILCFGDVILQNVVKLTKSKFSGKLVAQKKLYNSKNLSIVSTGIGGPSAAIVIEKLIACGAKEFMCVGFVGSINEKLRSNDILLVTKAYKGDGLSYNYLPHKKFVSSDVGLTNKMKKLLEKERLDYKEGCVWTTDAIYRETPEKVRRFGKKCLGVDMETASVLSVSKYRKVKTCALMLATDELFTLKWKPASSQDVKKNLNVLCNIASQF